MVNQILGFDFRVADWPGITAWWDEPRRAHYLLRPEVPWVASVDSAVLPSVFDFGNALNSPATGFAISRLIPEGMHQQAFGLWRDLGAMQQAVSRQSLPKDATYMSIALTVIGDDLPATQWAWDDLLEERTNPPTVSQGWKLLGYDVADRSLLSGLSNCGYDGDEKPILTKTWPDKLNEVGLLRDLNDAMEFKDVTNRRVPEHAPFLFFGLYELS